MTQKQKLEEMPAKETSISLKMDVEKVTRLRPILHKVFFLSLFSVFSSFFFSSFVFSFRVGMIKYPGLRIRKVT